MILTACVKNGTTAHFTSDWKLWRLNFAIIEAKQNSQIVSNFRGCRVFKSRLVTSFIMEIQSRIWYVYQAVFRPGACYR